MFGLFINKDDDSETSNNSSSSSTVSETFFDVVDSDIDRNSEVRYYFFVVYICKHCLLILYL